MGKDKIHISVLETKGYVWTAEDALALRQEYGIVGACIGGVAAFKQQNQVRGLPLQLSQEEVTLCLEKGWGIIDPHLGVAQFALANASGSRKRQRTSGFYTDAADDEESDADFSDLSDISDVEDVDAPKEKAVAEPPWQQALLKGTAFDIPMRPVDVPDHKALQLHTEAGTGSKVTAPSISNWTFPSTTAERHRYWIFKDLHSRGYRVTAGSKFGADYLLYPGDPGVYHAQFCVRLVGPDQVMLPALFAATCRGSFQARKHVIIASVIENESSDEVKAAQEMGSKNAGGSAEEGGLGGQLTSVQGDRYRILYTTAGPVDGFG